MQSHVLLFFVLSLLLTAFGYRNNPIRVGSTFSHIRLYSEAPSENAETSNNAKCGPCKFAPLCSGEYAEKGCDGTGRISGGVGAVLPWFPVKVYRPCPSFLAAGYQYRREGQTMDQVLFSEPSDRMKEEMRKIRERNPDAKLYESPGLVDEEKSIDGSNSAEVDRILREKFGKE